MIASFHPQLLDSTWICLDLEMPQRADPAERAMAELG